ncbi:hypothetical protein F9C07_2283729 [Aspergillus flavus]|uniref:Uncharacterized protein n=1 Tax=Aspergillus flavus (strain ATCC 200026 / FGSC A1120 / IAM 13836 / NRRL 3357 / JCM 12722 / SRRC 167) TaxID=332952 RepID=A0A7U2R135_ASPFN|nr:hypothetical protein F9C07_2283729 [Aspergillus flavus]
MQGRPSYFCLIIALYANLLDVKTLKGPFSSDDPWFILSTTRTATHGQHAVGFPIIFYFDLNEKAHKDLKSVLLQG